MYLIAIVFPSKILSQYRKVCKVRRLGKACSISEKRWLHQQRPPKKQKLRSSIQNFSTTLLCRYRQAKLVALQEVVIQALNRNRLRAKIIWGSEVDQKSCFSRNFEKWIDGFFWPFTRIRRRSDWSLRKWRKIRGWKFLIARPELAWQIKILHVSKKKRMKTIWCYK